jgi:hypothetical protein
MPRVAVGGSGIARVQPVGVERLHDQRVDLADPGIYWTF